ncbi:type II toxin-antitoxin system VapC family toxin [Haloterrigena alkaliphila]|uniref:Type II toxin-antitoxin system VapC family toxin n=1 Tax=Haloterrigena alkaliphila TaxID=2816475 RepID=A0A8A2VJ43_9EURY|nr:PIN domain-containing protein [Haloterrigena alkaliphila]QSX00731.1 PIN domain-containing protein [Haloterrigena alkaliphila]
MSELGATPLFVDTGAFYAYYDESASRHDRAAAVFDAIASEGVQYRPLYTTTHVLAELSTLLARKRDHETAVRGLRRIRNSSAFSIVRPTEDEFEVACRQFERYDDREITLVDHLTAVLADERATDHVFAFDTDFQTLGFTLVPRDVDIDV